MCVIITRPEKDSLTISNMLDKHGVSNFIEPMFKVVYLPLSLAEIQFFFSDAFQAIILTSHNAVEALAKATSGRHKPLVVISESSANFAKKLGFINVISAQGNVDSLIKMIIEKFNPYRGKLGYLSGRIISQDLKKILTEQGFAVNQLEVYHTVPKTNFSSCMVELINKGEVKIILFYSNRTVEIFYSLARESSMLDLFKNITAITISENIASNLKKINWQDIAIISSPKSEIMVNKIMELYI